MMKCYFDGWNFWHALILSGLMIWEWYLGRYGKTAKSTIDLVWMTVCMVVIVGGLVICFLRREKKDD